MPDFIPGMRPEPLTVSRLFQAPPEAVFRALREIEEVAQRLAAVEGRPDGAEGDRLGVGDPGVVKQDVEAAAGETVVHPRLKLSASDTTADNPKLVSAVDAALAS